MRRKRPRWLRIARVTIRRFDRHTPEWMGWLTPWGTSLTVHAVGLLALGLVYYAGGGEQDTVHIDTTFPSQLKDDLDALTKGDQAGDPFTTIQSDEPPSFAPEIDPNSDVIAVSELPPAARLGETIQLNAPTSGAVQAKVGDGTVKGLARSGELTAPFSGRQAATRARLVQREGGSAQSEKAVERGLDWLARHQRADGGWSLNHRTTCKGRGCPPDRYMDADTAATGLALLPLLGAGHSHVEKGRYQRVVDAGIQWLLKVQKPDGDMFLGSGNTRMYSQAIATMALSEAYGLTKDEKLKEPAQRAVHFIVEAQNVADGGWRYQPGEAGDTSVFGWQMFALRSAQLAGLEVQSKAVQGCRKYLDRAATDPNGTSYAYLPGQGASPVMTAEALLGRQYLGWNRESPALRVGAAQVAANLLESRDRNIYYWYYATQLLHNMQGPAWQVWNRKVRDGLVAMQVTGKGCDYGSWHPTIPQPDVWGREAGRHFVTSLSLLTLEVYYRYLPIYRERDRNPVGGEEITKNIAVEAKAAAKKEQ